MIPHKCPVCNGTGLVPAGFYSNGVADGTAPERCRSCGGQGIVWGQDLCFYAPLSSGVSVSWSGGGPGITKGEVLPMGDVPQGGD